MRQASFSATRDLVGKRRAASEIDPASELAQARSLYETLSQAKPIETTSLGDLKRHYASACRTYYTIAAISRRRILEEEVRRNILRLLFPLRSRIERSISTDLFLVKDSDKVFAEATSRSFFGVSSKQGVSIRYPLLSCAPTLECGGRCYAHDGRDRELHLIFRGVLNHYCGQQYESGSVARRRGVIEALAPSVKYAVKRALDDAKSAAQSGFSREPRIRFSHVGEMATTPKFANELAAQIKILEPTIACVVYTRHPDAKHFDPKLFRVNFTLDQVDDNRRNLAPSFARLVSSAWDGRVSNEVDVNFLEHHVEKAAALKGKGFACPVTIDHLNKPSCDLAKCDICFRVRVGE